MTRDEITGLLLAGGRGNRMGGVDKGLQSHRGRPLVEWAIERFAPQVGTLCISANRNLATYRAYGFSVVEDELPGFRGPLTGLLSGMTCCATPYLATVPCDVPTLPLDVVERLARAFADDGAEIAIARIRTGDEARIQPVFALLGCSLQPSLRDFVEAGGSKVREWMFRHRCVEVDFDDPAAFTNINTIVELDPRPDSNDAPRAD